MGEGSSRFFAPYLCCARYASYVYMLRFFALYLCCASYFNTYRAETRDKVSPGSDVGATWLSFEASRQAFSMIRGDMASSILTTLSSLGWELCMYTLAVG